MPLTRHFYEQDEVVSALQTCLQNGWESRGLFWLWELTVSRELELATKTVRDTWLLFGGCRDPECLQEPRLLEFYTRVSAAIQFSRTSELTVYRFLNQTASSLMRFAPTPKATTAAARTRRRVRSAQFIQAIQQQLDNPDTIKPLYEFWISLDSACRCSNRHDALWLFQVALQRGFLTEDQLWIAIRIMARGYHTALSILEAGHDFLYMANAILYLCMRDCDLQQPQPQPQLYTYNYRLWYSWSAQEGRRSARQYAIPPDAILSGSNTTRGQIPRKYTNIADIRDPRTLLFEGCRFWRDQLTATISCGFALNDEGEDDIVITDDDAYEAFCDRFFPDDFPDEWSKQDQEKSHGRGVMIVSPSRPRPCPRPCTIMTPPISTFDWKFSISVTDLDLDLDSDTE